MLKVTVAEVQRTILKQFGINLGALVNSGNFSTAILSENALPLTAAAGLGSLPIPGVGTTSGRARSRARQRGVGLQPSGSAAFGNSGFATHAGGNGRSAACALRALERDGLVRTLAEPNLTAVSGETAKFLAGGEFPFPWSTATASCPSPSRSSASASPSRRSCCRRAASA